MARIPYDQANFTQGELSPRTYARTDLEAYYKGAKGLLNSLVTPEGGVIGRFGTQYVDSSATNNEKALNGYYLTIGLATYLLEFGPNIFYVYLENTLLTPDGVATPYPLEDVPKLKLTQTRNRIIITSGTRVPTQVVAGPSAAVNISFTAGSPNLLRGPFINFRAGTVAAIQFSGTMPPPVGATKRLYAGRTYYARSQGGITRTNIAIWDTPEEAAINDYTDNSYSFSGAGFCTAQLINTFTLSDIAFQNVPTYDFSNGYPTTTFTPSALFGTVATPLTITASSAVFTTQHVGGVFGGNGGIVRILGIGGASPSTTATGYTVHDFPNLNAIPGGVANLEMPAWSDAVGWPSVAISFENRLWFAYTSSLPGVWGSATGEYYNFDDSDDNDPSGGISWYPESGGPVIINAMTAANSLLVHTNRGTYSTPVFQDVNLTPHNFLLKIQDKDGVSAKVQPVSLDNQVFYVSTNGASVKSLRWQTELSKYSVANVSVKSSHLIRKPIDAAAFTNPSIEGTLFLLINKDGTLVIFQTLIEENIAAFSPATTRAGDRFVQLVSNGSRVWVWVMRGGNIRIEELCFSVFLGGVNGVEQPVNMDSCTRPRLLESGATTVATTHFNEGDSVSLVGSGGDVQEGLVVGPLGSINFAPLTAQQYVQFGYNFSSQLIPLPIGVIPGTICTRYTRKNIVGIYVFYNDTNGATVNGEPILTGFLPVDFGPPPVTGAKVSEFIDISVGWDINLPDIVLEQAHPLPFNILAIAYILEV